MAKPSTFLLLGATGGTGKHFLTLALSHGHAVRAFVRTPSKLPSPSPARLEVTQGSITDLTNIDFDALVKGADYVVCMLGDREAQESTKINAAFMKELIPAMRTHGVKRLLYQAGGFSRPYQTSLSPILWVMRNTIARSFEGQHQDNEAVMAYLATECMDIEWINHRAGIGGDGESKGSLERTTGWPSVATFKDCAEYSYRLVMDDGAVHTSDFSRYMSN